jgi:hypothetical protein
MTNNQKHLARVLVVIALSFTFVAGYVTSLDRTTSPKAIFTGNEEHRISTEAALRYVANYHAMEGAQLTAGYMGRNIFEQILAQEEAVGIRIYNARLDNGSPTYVIVGVDREGNDLIGGVIGEDVIQCPPWCPDGTLRLYPDQQSLALK